VNAAPAALEARDWVAPPEFARHRLPDCDDVFYLPAFQSEAAALACYTAVAAQTQWLDESMQLFGRAVAMPRRCAWSGDAGVTYGYSRLVHRASGWTPATAALRDDLLERLGVRFNFVLLNLYRDGNDCMGWHSDDEDELGQHPCIASLSLGAPRRFCLRARDGTNRRAHVWLESGSLLVMWGRSQRDWMHSLPRARSCDAPRINLTFRLVRASA
jgi:alkylated DNA repair dioxygenase AlkB